jgi:hypothetical protein
MRRLTSATLFGLILLPAACTPSGGTGQTPSQPQPEPRHTASGSLGSHKTNDFTAKLPFYKDGELMVYLAISGYPGKPLGPAYVLVTRLAFTDRLLYDGGFGMSNDYLAISPAQYDSKERPFRFNYSAEGKPIVEKFSAGNKTYQPDDGCVFLLDLSADPPSVTQLKVDLTDVLAAHAEASPSAAELKAAVEKLADKDKAVREFMDRIPKR